ncbi:MAG: dienelactone hydrolase family protein [Actinomycetota bacterium]|nr:MAG: dienelactone hydrolase family protein [Actinomycetota bacterium]
MELQDYLRDEILEEAELGYITLEERDRRLSVFDDALGNAQGLHSASAVLSAQNPISEVQVEELEGDIIAWRDRAAGSESDVLVYAAKPKEGKSHPGVIVIHENKGLVPYVEDVARRFAREGYVAVAPDLLSRRGGTGSFSDPSEATTALGTIGRDELVEDLISAVTFLASDESVSPQRIGVVGFCFGGGMAWRLITKDARIKAAVPFYGPNPPLEDVPDINASVLGIYGGLDDRINAGIDDIEAAMSENNKVFEKIIYPGAQHAFHNDTNPDRYHPEASIDAWQRALEWLSRWLPES